MKRGRRKMGRPAGRTTKALARIVQAPPPKAGPLARDLPPRQILAMRELFWHNVIREILTSLSMLASLRPGADEPPPAEPPAPAADGRPQYDPSLFDGRLAVMTKSGERVAIADVFPLFACGINTPAQRPLALAVECSVFQIRTPGGQVYTLPLHEIRSFHALTPELMQRLERAARRRRRSAQDGDDQQPPFGFAAFTSLAQGAPVPLEPAPDYPIE
jgi:hypothetical protein